ncbi:MAG: hypothetical protein WCS07_00360 [Sphaerochaeta sp.]
MKRTSLLLSLFLLVVMLTSCATSVSVRHLVPGEVDLSDFRSVAVASVSPYQFPSARPLSPWISGLQETDFTLSSGYELSIGTQVADLATDMLVQSLGQTGYFSVLPPSITDAYVSLGSVGEDVQGLLNAKGVQALLVSDITYLDMEESIVGRDVRTYVTEGTLHYEKVTSREYYLIQKATLSLTYSLLDISQNRILLSKSFTDKQERETKIGTRIYLFDTGTVGAYRDERRYASGHAPSFAPLFEQILTRFSPTIGGQLAPSYQLSQLPLLGNKPKRKEVEPAYKLVRQSSYADAYALFLETWEEQGHIPSGYNAALLLEALGRMDEAVELMSKVYHSTASQQAHDALLRMQEALSGQKKAERQISGDLNRDGQGVTMTQYMVME